MSFLFFIMALSCGISRIYLEEHFFQDVYFGSMIGLLCAMISFAIFQFTGYLEKELGLAGTARKLFKND
jgi:hypothetical protein